MTSTSPRVEVRRRSTGPLNRFASTVGANVGEPLGLWLLKPSLRAAGIRTRRYVRDVAGNSIGVVRFSEDDGAVLVRANLHGVPEGYHGFHVHETGVCEPPFTSAGGHFNPEGTAHGDHAGDLPSLLVNDDGTAFLWFKTDRFSIEDLFDEDGSAIIVHANRDNFANIPERYHSHTEDVFGPDSATLATGDAGGRLACGVVDQGGNG